VPTYHAEIRTSQSPEQVFDYLARFSSVAEWDASVVSAEMLTPEPVEAGSEFKVVVRSFGRELPFVYRISTFDRPHLVRLVADTGRLRSEDTITVEPDGDGSRVVYDARLSAKGIASLANPLLAIALRRIGDAAAAGLRAMITSPA
jgi:Polyketide cyclase / dehydrase and lipid transport